MSAEVKKLTLVKDEPDQGVVEVLEECLELAKSGELRSVAVVGDTRGNMIFRHCAFEDRIRLLGHLTMVVDKVVNG